MGVYLNNKSAHLLFREERSNTYFIDKTEIISELVPLVGTPCKEEILALETVEYEASLVCEEAVPYGKEASMGDARPDGKVTRMAQGRSPKYVCITRPRRFGKTVMANMIASYFGKGADSSKIFQGLKVSGYPWYREHLNRHNVIHIMCNEMPDEKATYEQYISRMKRRLLHDLKMAYPSAGIEEEGAVWDALNNIVEYCDGETFIFVLDEWDFIYHQDFVTDADKVAYTKFLSNLLKDKAYVEMVYMTGILPIAKYASGSELNMFCEYTMASEEKYASYFGFTEKEVDELYQRYLSRSWEKKRITRDGLRIWYDGYHTKAGERVYNPRSVVLALTNNNLGNYWTSSGPYDELFYYIGADVDEMKRDVSLLLAEIPVPAKIQEYAATSMELKTRDEIFSAMVVYGFLNYENGCVSIPNRELVDKFADMVQREPSMGSVYRLTRESRRMLLATKAGDTKTMSEILQLVHDTESPLEVYHNEAELASIIRLVYLQARDQYRIEREDKAGLGYVDYIFYPYTKSDDAMILELKVCHTAEEAISQIRERKYALRFEGRIGEKTEYTGRILAVGIAYDKKDPARRHTCRVEILRERLP